MKVMNKDKIKNLPQKLQDIWWKMLHAANDECKVMVEKSETEEPEKEEGNEVKDDETNVGKEIWLTIPTKHVTGASASRAAKT